MNKRKIWLLFVPMIISFFVFGLSVNAEETGELDSAIPLSLNQTLTASFKDSGVLRHYYKIELSQKSGITIYGNTISEYLRKDGLDLELQDVNGKSVFRNSKVEVVSGNYRWRTDEVDPGTYYIVVNSGDGLVSYGINDYSIAYSQEVYPVYTELTENTEIKCKAGINVFKINISSPTNLTVYGIEGIEGQVRVKFADVNGKEISNQYGKTNQADYKAVVKGLLPGIYFIETIGYPLGSDFSYSVLYSTDPYPESILLERGKGTAGSLHPGFSSDIYRINIDTKQKITFLFSTKYQKISFHLYDFESNCVADMESVAEKTSSKWSPNVELMPGTYYLEVAGNDDYSVMWQTRGPSAVTDLKMSSATRKSITLRWDESQEASKYKIYKYNPNKKKYYLKKTTTNGYCTISGLKVATKYAFKVVPVVSINGEDIKGESTVLKAYTKPEKVLIESITKTRSGIVSGYPVNYYKIKWKKAKNVKSYQVYVKTEGSDWKKKSVTSSSSYVIHVVKGHSIKIKVRAYTSTKDAITYGSFSKIKNIKSNVK